MGVEAVTLETMLSFFIMSKKIQVNIGDRYGRWTVIEEVPRNKIPHGVNKRFFFCRCDCGFEKRVQFSNLQRRLSISCGCYKDEFQRAKIPHNKTTGLSKTRIYGVYGNMKDRCNNPNSDHYHRYGGRGIKVCDRWQGDGGFENFYADMGPRPSSLHTLDRINNDGNYEPGNCRWATIDIQANNRNSNVSITLNGETKTIAQWSKVTGIGATTILYRKNAGKTPEECLSEIEDRYKNAYKGPKGLKPKSDKPKQVRKKWVVGAGDRFGRLVVVELFKKLAETGTRKGINNTFCKCSCDCGGTKDVLKSELCKGRTNSCGCIRIELNRAMAKAQRKY